MATIKLVFGRNQSVILGKIKFWSKLNLQCGYKKIYFKYKERIETFLSVLAIYEYIHSCNELCKIYVALSLSPCPGHISLKIISLVFCITSNDGLFIQGIRA